MIPPRIIQTGPKDLPLSLKAGMANAKLLHPTFEYLFFDDAQVESFIQEEFPQYKDTFHSFPFRIQRYDFFRYLAIYRYGGFYLDLDVLLAEPLTPLLKRDCVFSFEELTDSRYFWRRFQMDWQIGNYAFGAAPGHRFLGAIIDNCVRAQQDPAWLSPMIQWVPKPFRAEAYILNTTGPGLVSRTLGENPPCPDLTILFPEDVCDPEQWHRFGDFGVHNMAGSWREHDRTTFLRPLWRRWNSWKQQRTLVRSRRRGGARQYGDLESGLLAPSSGGFTEAKPKSNRQQPLVSILIPAFNAEKWIAATIRSGLSQTWPNKEIIIVDDGSSDRTLETAQEFASSSVKVVTQPHSGAASARNHAFSICDGDYIQWLDADDLLAPDKIAQQVEAANQCKSTRTLLSSPWAPFLHRYYRAEFTPSPLWCDLSPSNWILRKMALGCFIQTGAWLVSRQLTEAAGPWNSKLLGDDDGEYFCRVVLGSDLVRFVPSARTYYRNTGPGSLSYIGASPEKLSAQWLSMKLHIGYVRSVDDSPKAQAACLSYLQRNLINFYPEYRDILQEAYQLAAELGGQLEAPCLPAKYSWIPALLGWGTAKHVQRFMPRIRWGAQRVWDKAMLTLDTRFSRVAQHNARIGYTK